MNIANIYKIVIGIILFSSVQLNAQQYFHENRHSTNHFDGWVSCTATTNPNPARPVGHWIKYDLGFPYVLGSSHIWNINDPDNLNAGIKDMAIDYSDDGVSWTELGVFNMTKSNGSLYYQGTVGPNFNNIKAKYILFTALDNYGAACSGFSEIKINIVDPTLPLELISFEVNCIDNNTNQISWTTANEKNIDIFKVERSEDGKQWSLVNTISDNTESYDIKEYEIFDIVDKAYYYRLKVLDLSGQISYSNTEISDCNRTSRGLSVFPNPTSGITIISFNSINENDNYNFKLYDVVGKLIQDKTIALNKGTTKIELNTEEFVPGEYFIHIQLGNELLVKKLIVF